MMNTPHDPAAAARTAALLTSLWQRNLPMIRDRLALLERAAELAAEGHLSPALREDAAMTAHKLAGSLGMFGYGEGTRIARSLEQLLDAPQCSSSPALNRLVGDLRTALLLQQSNA